jgi:hypothetical protein
MLTYKVNPVNKIYGEKLIAWLYISLIATSILGDILYWLASKSFAGYAKLFFYPALLIILIELLVNKKIIKDDFLIFISFTAGICLIIGLSNNQIGKAFFAHFLPFTLPIFAYSYGLRSELASGGLSATIDKYAIKAGYILVGLVIVYYPLVQGGYVAYFGAGALFAYPIFYALKEKLYYSAIIFYVANIFTGKRSVFLAITIVLLIYLYKKCNTVVRMLTLGLAALLATFFYMEGGSSEGHLGGGLDRYLIIFQYLAENDDVFRAIDLATSGRLYDVFAVIDRLGDNMFNWLFGIGFGAVFTIDYSFSDESHITHYSHVTPFSYLLLGGFLLLIVVYAKLLLEIKYALKKIDDHLSMMLVYFFVIGFSGAIFFTDVFVWLIIGMFTAARIKAQKIQ